MGFHSCSPLLWMQLLLVHLLLAPTLSCTISGTDIGECVNRSQVQDQLHFCNNYLQEQVCVPLAREVWPKYSVSYRDTVVERMYMQNIEEMLQHEFVNRDSNIQFQNSVECSEAYKSFLCQMNFPGCDSKEETMKLCSSVCDGFYKMCGKSTDMCQLIYNKMAPGFEEC